MNTAQLMALISLIDFPMPSNNKRLFELLSLANGDSKYLSYLPNIFRKTEAINIAQLEKQSALNSQFDAAGYESSSFYLLSEPKLILFLYYIGVILPLVITALIIRKSPRW